MRSLKYGAGNLMLGIFGAVVCSAPVILAAERTWTRSEICTIADAEARRLGYDPEQKSITIHKDAGWLEFVAGTNLKDWDYSQVKTEVAGHLLWAIRYDDLNEQTLGGSMWVFINRETGDIIATLPGQPL